MMSIEEIMSNLDDERISKLGEMYKIDKINTKITGKFILKSFVYGALQGVPMSLRSIEAMVKKNKNIANTLKSKDPNKKIVDHSSFGKRFKFDLYKSIIKDIVLFCGGNPHLVDQRF